MNDRQQNLVERVIHAAGGVGVLSRQHNVSRQSVNLWRLNGYFPLEQIPVVMSNFPNFQAHEFIDAYKKFKEQHHD